MSFAHWIFALLFAGLICGEEAFAASPQPELVKNVYTGEVPSEGLKPRLQVALGSKVLMVADDGVCGEELWISDGTVAGTRMVKDIWPGKNGSSLDRFTKASDKAYFTADDGVLGKRLWVTDGTETGTKMVVGMPYGRQSSGPDQMVGGSEGLVSLVIDADSGRMLLWHVSNAGGEARKLATSPHWLNLSTVRLWSDDQHVWATFPEETTGQEWVCRIEGGQLIKVVALPEGAVGFPIGKLGGDFLAYLYLPTPTSRYNSAVWKCSANGWEQLSTNRLETGIFVRGGPLTTVANGTAYFLYPDSSLVRGPLWMTNGTAAGTRYLISPNNSTQCVEMVLAGQKLVINAGTHLWTRHLQTGAQEVLFTASSLGSGYGISGLRRFGNEIVFTTANSSTEALRFWISDATAAGTRTLAPELSFSYGSTWGAGTVIAGEQMFFEARVTGGTHELWKSDGTQEGTLQLTAKPPADGGSSPQRLRALSGLLYFTADDGIHGRELWRSDGTPQGTHMLRDIYPGDTGGEPQNLVEMNGSVYFTARDPDRGREWWRTDGTPEGTALVCETRPGTSGLTLVAKAFVFQGRLYFTGPHESVSTAVRLWTSDGTAAGTFAYPALVRENMLMGSFLAEMDGCLYFSGMEQSSAPGSASLLLRINGDLETLERCGSAYIYQPQVVVRPPTAGAVVAPDKHVLYLAAGSRLIRCCNGESFRPVCYAASGIEHLRVHGKGLLFTQTFEGGDDNLFWTDGTTANPVRWGPDGYVRLMQESSGKIYFSQIVLGEDYGVYENRALNCMNLDGTEQTKLLPEETASFFDDARKAASVIPLHAEDGAVYFSRSVRGSLPVVWRSYGTPGTTRMVSRMPLSSVAGLTTVSGVSDELYTVVQKLGTRLYFSGNGPQGDELYSLSLEGVFEAEELLADGGHRDLESGGSVTWSLTAVGQEEQVVLRLRNDGGLPLSNVTVSLTAGSDFTAETSGIDLLAPGASGEIRVTFSPTAGGLRQSTLTITGQGPGAAVHTVQLTGTGLGLDELPVLRASPQSRMVFAGQSLTLQTDILSAAPFTSTVWRRDTTAVSSTMDLSIPAAKLTDAGSYQLTVATAAGELSSVPARVAVLTPALGEVTADEWGPLTLACLAQAPADCQLRYQWRHNGIPLGDDGVVKGSALNTLKISRMESFRAGDYDCVVTVLGPDGQVLVTADGPLRRSHGITQVRVRERPRILETELAFPVSVAVQHQVSTHVPATVFTAKGLPPGLKMSKTGLITGIPTRSFGADAAGEFLPYRVTLTAANAVGTGPAQVVMVLVKPFVPAGGYDCLLGPVEGVSHGGQVKFTVTSSGALSGQVAHRGKVLRFASNKLVADAASATLRMTISLGRGDTAPKLQFTPPEAVSEPWTVTLTEGQTLSLSGLCRRHLFSASRTTISYTAPCVFVMSAENDVSKPEGSGYLTTSATKTGLMTWKGRLPDGTALIGSNALSSLRPGGVVELPVHTDLYKATGSLNGTARFPSEADALLYGLRSLSGSFSWGKQKTENNKERNYREGFARHVLQLQGKWIQLLSVGAYPLGLQGAAGQVTLTGTDLELQQTFSVTLQQKLLLPAMSFAEGTFLKSLSFAAKAGIFKGTVSVPHPTDPKLNRTGSFEGGIVSDSLVEGFAEGFCLLPDLPGEGETLKTSPLKSYRIRIVRK